MKIKALIPAALIAIVGSSSLAMARPVTVSGQASIEWGTSSGPVVRDHRYTQPTRISYQNEGRWNRHREPSWGYHQPRFQTLDEGLQFGYTEYRKDILVGSAAGRFNTLRIDSDGGQTYLMKVVVEFADNSVQVIQLNRTLRGYQSLTLPLDFTKAIHRVFVYRADGDAAHNMRRYHDGAFTVSAL